MFGGVSNGNPNFPVFMEENHFQYDMSSLPQLQLFGEIPVGCNIDPINYITNEHASASSCPMKRPCEPEPVSRQQKLHFSLNSNFCPDETAQNESILNQNPVLTGLRLSYEEDERNSAVTSVSENIKATFPPTLSLANSFKIELDRQKAEFDHYITLQERNTMKGVRELSQRHTATFLNTLEQGVNKKLQEKAMDIEKMNQKNKELGEKIKQVSVEAQNWHYRAKCNESIVNALKTNLQEVIEKGAAHAREGCGDSEVDDAASYANNQSLAGTSWNLGPTKYLNCKACKVKQVSILLLPCRHLCLCQVCDGLIDVCPICQLTKSASVQVYLS